MTNLSKLWRIMANLGEFRRFLVAFGRIYEANSVYMVYTLLAPAGLDWCDLGSMTEFPSCKLNRPAPYRLGRRLYSGLIFGLPAETKIQRSELVILLTILYGFS